MTGIFWRAQEPIIYHGSWPTPWRWGFGKLTKGMHYYGDFAGGVLMPIVISLLYALVAAAVGFSVAWIVDSDRPIGWTLVPRFLYALAARHFVHWANPPTLIERVGAIIGASFPAIACMVAATFAARRPTTSQVSRSTPSLPVSFSLCLEHVEHWELIASRGDRPSHPI
jgi:hypothetical protein